MRFPRRIFFTKSGVPQLFSPVCCGAIKGFIENGNNLSLSVFMGSIRY